MFWYFDESSLQVTVENWLTYIGPRKHKQIEWNEMCSDKNEP